MLFRSTTELEHILATQCIAIKKPKRMRIRVDGTLRDYVRAKDVALRIIGVIGSSGGRDERSTRTSLN